MKMINIIPQAHSDALCRKGIWQPRKNGGGNSGWTRQRGRLSGSG